MPYSVVNVGGARDTSSNLTIQWMRRSRFDNEWVDNADVPLNEETESYSIDILDGVTVVRTLTSTSQSVSYTAAEQTTDFGSPQSSVSCVIYQISAVVGRGFPRTATV